MITETDQPINHPPRITPVAIDLAMYSDTDGDEHVILRVIDSETGAMVDLVLERRKAAAFGKSLDKFATEEPEWLEDLELLLPNTVLDRFADLGEDNWL
jgi:hypothetical protein